MEESKKKFVLCSLISIILLNLISVVINYYYPTTTAAAVAATTTTTVAVVVVAAAVAAAATTTTTTTIIITILFMLMVQCGTLLCVKYYLRLLVIYGDTEPLLFMVGSVVIIVLGLVGIRFETPKLFHLSLFLSVVGFLVYSDVVCEFLYCLI